MATPLIHLLGIVLALAPGADGSPTSLAARLRAELGGAGSIAVLGSYDGLFALSRDGRRERLVPGPVFDVRVDRRGDVIWYRAGRTARTYDLMALDLREAEVKPVLVARDLGLMDDPDIAYTDPDEVSPPGEKTTTPTLTGTGPLLWRVAGCAGKQRRPCAKVKRVPCEPRRGRRCFSLEAAALPFLRSVAERGVGRSLFAPPAPAPATTRVPLGDASCRRCGRSAVIPGTPYWAVSTQAMGDFCHVVSEIYDPRTREFVDPDDGQRSPTPFEELGADFGDAWVSAAGDAFIQLGVLHTFAHGRVLWRGPADGGGFLDGGRWMPARAEPCE